jgi:hypothetical protein
MNRFLLPVLLVTLMAVAGLASAKPGIVTTKAGQVFEGDVVEEAEVVIVTTASGVKMRVPRTSIASIEYVGTFPERLAEKRSKLAAGDVKGRLELAQWCLERRQYPAARELAEEALRIDPNSRAATDLLELIRIQVQMDRKSTAGAVVPETVVESVTAAPPTPATQPASVPRLTSDEVNTIRLAELRQGDVARINIPTRTRQEFATRKNLKFQDFNALSPLEQAIRIRESDEKDLAATIKVHSDPIAIADFKKSVQPIVLQNCATSACHGGDTAGTFRLINPAADDIATYTNFYILQNTGTKVTTGSGGLFAGPASRRLIERGRGADSLLVNYLLPASVADYDHPELPEMRAMARTRDDKRLQAIVSWMDQTLRPTEPNYGISLKVGTAATRPSRP